MLDSDSIKLQQSQVLFADVDTVFGEEVLEVSDKLETENHDHELGLNAPLNNNNDSSVTQEVSMEGLLKGTRAEYRNLPKNSMEDSAPEEKVKDEISAKKEEEKSDEELEKDSEVEISSSI